MVGNRNEPSMKRLFAIFLGIWWNPWACICHYWNAYTGRNCCCFVWWVAGIKRSSVAPIVYRHYFGSRNFQHSRRKQQDCLTILKEWCSLWVLVSTIVHHKGTLVESHERGLFQSWSQHRTFSLLLDLVKRRLKNKEFPSVSKVSLRKGVATILYRLLSA